MWRVRPKFRDWICKGAVFRSRRAHHRHSDQKRSHIIFLFLFLTCPSIVPCVRIMREYPLLGIRFSRVLQTKRFFPPFLKPCDRTRKSTFELCKVQDFQNHLTDSKEQSIFQQPFPPLPDVNYLNNFLLCIFGDVPTPYSNWDAVVVVTFSPTPPFVFFLLRSNCFRPRPTLTALWAKSGTLASPMAALAISSSRGLVCFSIRCSLQSPCGGTLEVFLPRPECCQLWTRTGGLRSDASCRTGLRF